MQKDRIGSSEASKRNLWGSIPRATPIHPHEMERIRKVFDTHVAAKKHSAIVSPREDAQTFRNAEKHSVPCECIAEMYEMLWRWGHRITDSEPSFSKSFGFAIVDTVVIVQGKPYAWYFISKKDGSLLRKSDNQLNATMIEKKFCKDAESRPDGSICATWYPSASQFSEAKCHSSYADFMSAGRVRSFLGSLHGGHSGVLQVFVEPQGVSNFLIRTVRFRNQTSLCVRTNRTLLSKPGNMFGTAATFEGWPGLSSDYSRYRNKKIPHMERLILQVGETLNQRIEDERVRQMLFLGPEQHIALHFKIDKDSQLFFIYASIVSETDVILQTHGQLLMGDRCMTEPIKNVALLPGGSDRKAPLYQSPMLGIDPNRKVGGVEDEEDAEVQRKIDEYFATKALSSNSEDRDTFGGVIAGAPKQQQGLPPIQLSSLPVASSEIAPDLIGIDSGSRQIHIPSSSARKSKTGGAERLLPKMEASRPILPEVPYKVNRLPNSAREASRVGERYGASTVPGLGGLDTLRRPLITTSASAR